MNFSMDEEAVKKYNFSMSAFSRLFGPDHISMEMMNFCYCWAISEKEIEAKKLETIDFYFKELWNQQLSS